MVYANWLEELEAFEEDCDRLRKARRESLPVKVLGLAPIASLPLLGSVGVGRRLLALAGIATSGMSLFLELDKNRSAYGGNLAVDLNASSDYDNLAGAFRSRSPRWEALCYVYSQLDPIHLKDRLGHLSDDEGGKALNRMIRRIQKGLAEVRSLNPNKPGYDEIVLEVADEWREDVVKILDRCLFKAGVIDREDVEDLEDLEDEAIASEPNSDAVQSFSNVSETESDLDLFDWTELENFPNRFPHLLLLGKTGAGKTTLAEGLMELLPGERMVISPHLKPSDFKGIKAVGRGRNYVDILTALQSLEREMQRRYERYSEGDEDFNWLNVCIDEFPAITANCGKEAGEIMMLLAREARKVKIRLLILSQGFEVKALGIEGQGSVRECFTYIRLRGFAEDHARRLKNPQVIEAIANQAYPCMVEDTVADSSVLATLVEPLNRSQSSSEASHPMTAWVDSEDDSEGDEDDFLYPPVPKLLSGWTASPDALRLYGWMARKQQGTGQSRFTLNDLATGRPLGKKRSHSADIIQPLLSELLQGGLIKVDADRSIALNL